jgi:hypothetical protein
MKNYIMIIILGGILFILLTGTSLAANETTQNETYDAGAFQQALEKDGFTVQEGELAYFDLA